MTKKDAIGYLEWMRRDDDLKKDFNDALLVAISALQESKWIPISKKAHPTKEGKYLVTDDAGGMATVDVDDFIYCDDGSGTWLCSQNVTAWMSRPEPYREEGD